MKSFRNRLLILFASLSFTLGLLATLYLGNMVSKQLTQASGEVLHATAKSISTTLANALEEREREILLLSQSPFFVDADFKDPKLQLKLDQVKASYRYYVWLGIVDPTGKVIVAADRLLEGESAAERPWFIHGLNQMYLGDVHKARLLAKKVKALNPKEPLRLIDFATPIYDATGKTVRGVLGAHADWSWASHVLADALTENAKQKGVEIFIINSEAELLYPFKSIGKIQPPIRKDQARYSVVDWSDGKAYLTSSIPVISDTAMNLGWTIMIRQPIDLALAEVYSLKKKMLIFGFFITLLLLFVTYRLANLFSYPIEALDKTARAVEQDCRDVNFSQSTTILEINSLAQSLQSMTDTLRSQKAQLQEANSTLESKVKERTHALELANLELEKLARYDVLTGLYNRRAFNDYLSYLFAQFLRTQEPYSALLLDVDFFKTVNDRYGHEVGDQVLQGVAKILSDAVRSTDFTARFGGEEFVILLPATAFDGAMIVAEKIRDVIEQATIIEQQVLTISIGVSMVKVQDQDMHDLIRRADQALYQAKQQGRNRVVSQI